MHHLNSSIFACGLFIFTVTVGITGATLSYSAENTIRFGIVEKGYPPYLMNKKSGLNGIVGDIFREVSRSLGYRVEVIIRPKKRLERQIDIGEIDAIAGALEWRNDTIDHVSTDGIMRVSDNVVMTIDRQENLTTAAQLKDMVVTTRFGYKYPSLENMFAAGNINRVTTQSFESLLKMVAFRRVDYGIIDVNVANWVIRKHGLKFSPPLYFSKPGFDEVEFRIIFFSKKWTPFVKQFNDALSKFKTTNGWQKILSKYN